MKLINATEAIPTEQPVSRHERWLILLFLTLALIYGGTYLAVKEAVASFSPLQIASLRILASLLLLQIGILFMRRSLKIPRHWLLKAWLSGLLLQAIPFITLAYGMRRIAPGLGGIIEGSIPIFTFLFSLLLIKQREALPTQKLSGLLLGLGGLALIFMNQLHFHAKGGELIGLSSVLAMAASYALGLTLSRQLLASYEKLDLTAILYHQTLASSLLMITVTLIFEHGVLFAQSITLRALLGILFMILFSTFLAGLIYSLLIREWGSIRTASVCYLVPIAAVVLDFLFYRRVPSLIQLIGALIILIGVFLIQNHNLPTYYRYLKEAWIYYSRLALWTLEGIHHGLRHIQRGVIALGRLMLM